MATLKMSSKSQWGFMTVAICVVVVFVYAISKSGRNIEIEGGSERLNTSIHIKITDAEQKPNKK